MRLSIIFAFIIASCAPACERKVPVPVGAEQLPANLKPVTNEVKDLHYWSENGYFFVTGMCVNLSPGWQKMWYSATFKDKNNQEVRIRSAASAIVPLLTETVAPLGRSAFFAWWPLSDFSAPPEQCLVQLAGAEETPAGSVLVVSEFAGLKMAVPEAPGQPATKEIGWQASGKLLNPMPTSISHPNFVLMLYGNDNRLWFASRIQPGNPSLLFEAEGPLAPGQSRGFGIQVGYESLPASLRESKIGRAEILAFEAAR